MTALPNIFNPEPNDNEDVVSALETADIFWTKGDLDEAFRWLKRAAETASDAGNDMRALVLARGTADLKSGDGNDPNGSRSEVTSIRKSRPPTPPSSSSKPPPPPSSTMAVASNGSTRVHGSPKTPPPLPPSKSRESVIPAAPVKPRSLAPAGRTASSNRMAAVLPQTSETPVPRSALPTASANEPRRSTTPANAYRAVAVFVRPEGHSGDNLEVIVARPGQPVPPGAEPALLVPTRRGGRLLG